MDQFRELLKLKDSPNGGIAVTDDLKYTGACRPLRLLSINLTDCSQILATKLDPCVADCLVGWVGSQRDFQ